MIRTEATNRGFNVSLEMHLSDFEIAIRNSAERIFPAVETQACYFHYCHNIIRRLKKLNLFVDYCKDEEFQQTIRLLFALAHLHPDDIDQYFNGIFTAPVTTKGLTFPTWFQQFYIGCDDDDGVEHPPRFASEFWSVRKLIDRGFPKTQSRAEMLHHEIHELLAAEHVSLYKLIKFLLQILMKPLMVV